MSETRWHELQAASVVAALKTNSDTGLDADQVSARLAEYGYNELTHEQRASALQIFVNQFRNVLILILLAAVVLSMLVGEALDAAIILVIVVFCAVLGFVQEFRAERALQALKQMLAQAVSVLRDGRRVNIPARELVPGDIVFLEAGDRVAADLRLLESHSLRCDEAALTGESVPVDKETAALGMDTPLAERTNMALAGTAVTYGRGKAAVAATGMQTEFGKIAGQVAVIEVGKTPLEKRTAEIGKWLAIICLSICALVVAVSMVRGYVNGTLDLELAVTMTMFAIALAVAAVPEALAAIVTGALALGMHAMAKRNAIVRKMPAVETLGCTTVICSDKTGTLTTGEMTVRQVYGLAGTVGVGGAGFVPAGDLRRADGTSPLADPALQRLLQAAVLCNDSQLFEQHGRWHSEGDPTEVALLVLALKADVQPESMRSGNPRIEEFPFSSERKRMSTVHVLSDGSALVFMKGAPEVVLERCTSIADGGGERPLDDALREDVLHANETMANEALRVLALAYRPLGETALADVQHVESDMVFLGLAGMLDPPRPEVSDAVATCRSVCIRPVMITGDHQSTATAIAREIGIHQAGDRVLTGRELQALSDDEFAAAVNNVAVYARVSPMDKLRIVKALQARGEVVAMTGDGVNDAPAMKHADIGIAMGITGTDVAKEAADMVLSDDNFATIVAAVERGRWIYDNIKKYLAYLLQCNITEVVVIGGIVLMMGPEFLPLLPAAILYLNLATDGLPALALGVAPPEADIMTRPPRDPRESVFGWDVKSFILRAVIIECPFFYYLFLVNADNIEAARTAVFFMFVIVEFTIALNCRSLVYSVFRAPPHKWLVLALFWEVVLVAVLIQIPGVRDAFGITLPDWSELALITAFGVLVMAIIEVTKTVLRKRRSAVQAGAQAR